MKKIIFPLVAGLLVVAGSLKAETQVQTKNVFRFDSGAEPQSLDPQIATTVDASNTLMQLFEGLVMPDEKTVRVVSGVAEKWEISPDGKIYTFHLRKDAKWSDGKPVTAYDFEYAWERALNPKTGSEQASRLQYIKNAKDYLAGKLKDPKMLGFKAVDPLTFRVELEVPFPPFLDLATTPTLFPVRKDVVEKFGVNWVKPEHMISNGAFVLKEWKPFEKIILEKNQNYWDAKNVFLDQIVIYPIEDLETGLKRYSAGEVDFIDVLPIIKIPSLMKHPDYRSVPLFALGFYPLNTKKPSLSDPRVRKALSLAIDRTVLTRDVLRTGELPATGIIPPGVLGYQYSRLIEYNPEKAKKMLAEVGYPGGKGFPVLTISYNTMERHKAVAETIQQMWKKNLGIDVKLQNQEWKVHVASVRSHNFDVARFGGVGEYVYPPTFFEELETGSSANSTQWSNAEFDKLSKEVTKESNLQKRLRLYEKMEKIIVEEMPEIPLFYSSLYTLTKPHIQGLYLKPTHVYVFKYIRFKK